MRLSLPVGFGLTIALAALAVPRPVAAQDEVRLHEILPALEGTELGEVSLGPAPPPGGQRVVTRSEVLAALRRADRRAEGLAIPRVSRVRRGARRLDPAQLVEEAGPVAREALAPCVVERIDVRTEATVGEGPLSVSVEGRAPERSGSSPFVIVLEVGGRTVRVPAQATVRCPAPVVSPGGRLRLLARFGNVVASAPGVARQPGRVGDVIRVTSLSSHAPLRARILDAERAEVLP